MVTAGQVLPVGRRGEAVLAVERAGAAGRADVPVRTSWHSCGAEDPRRTRPGDDPLVIDAGDPGDPFRVLAGEVELHARIAPPKRLPKAKKRLIDRLRLRAADLDVDLADCPAGRLIPPPPPLAASRPARRRGTSSRRRRLGRRAAARSLRGRATARRWAASEPGWIDATLHAASTMQPTQQRQGRLMLNAEPACRTGSHRDVAAQC